MNEQEYLIRANSSMKQFTLFIDDFTKLKTIKKLKELGIDEKKGSIAATIRTLLNMFAENELDLDIIKVKKRIKEEYIFTTNKNKRSNL